MGYAIFANVWKLLGAYNVLLRVDFDVLSMLMLIVNVHPYSGLDSGHNATTGMHIELVLEAVAFVYICYPW